MSNGKNTKEKLEKHTEDWECPRNWVCFRALWWYNSVNISLLMEEKIQPKVKPKMLGIITSPKMLHS